MEKGLVELQNVINILAHSIFTLRSWASSVSELLPIKASGELEVLERHTSLDRDRGSSCTEVAI